MKPYRLIETPARYGIRVVAILLSLSATFLTGCEKFLDVNTSSNTNVTIRNIEDYEDILNNEGLANVNFSLYDMGSDDAFFNLYVYTNTAQSALGFMYMWRPTIFGSTEDDRLYVNIYNRINSLNLVIDNVMEALGGELSRKEAALAQAKIQRAYFYFQLVNMYAVAYDATTADVDPAVPLTLHAAPEFSPSRASITQVYTQVIQDLQEALDTESLPVFGVDVLHPGKAAAFAMLSRTYLYMNDYDHASQYADSTLSLRNTVLDYGTYTYAETRNDLQEVISATLSGGPISLREQTNNPEVIFAKLAIDNSFGLTTARSGYGVSKDLLALYDNNDYRLRFFQSDDYAMGMGMLYLRQVTAAGGFTTFNYSLTVPELMLTKAECLARDGDANGAIALVNELRKYRFSAENYILLTATDAEDALRKVLDERRRELVYKGGIRTFDLKRLNKDSRFAKSLERLDMTTGETLVLPPNDPRYVMPIAPKILNNNPNMVPNPR